MSNRLYKITTAIETAILSRVKNNSIFGEYYKRTDSTKVDWTKQAKTYKAKTINDWTMAVMIATDPLNPRRGELMRFYESLKLDLHLCSCVENRILPIQCAPFKLTGKDGVEDSEAHKLFEKPWYIELVKLISKHTYEGPILIEMMDLNDKGELKEVSEIPQSNFIAKDGIIIKQEYDTTGVSYKDGIYKDYYLQIGNDYALGMFNQIAMIVLAKKLGLGSWMSYIDKFGVPAVFAITERMDKERTNELFEMLANFRSNHFAVLQGSEKIEVPDNYGSDGYKSFEALNKHCDDSMSKFFLGGTGTSDAKSFVGSAEVHERLLKYRHQVDKLLIKYYINEEIIPRLVKLSSVYSPLTNLYYDFDESETMTLEQKIKAVVDLSKFYKFDAAELAKITGLPITEINEVLAASTPPATEPQKKKPNASVRLHYPPVARTNIYASTWDKKAQTLANDIYTGKVKPSDLHKETVISHYNTFNNSASEAWGKDYLEADITSQIRDNLMKFSGAKTYNLMSHLNDLTGKGLDKDQYMTEAQKVMFLHNDIYLGVEKNFVASCANSAKDWEQFAKDIDIYPNLMFKTMEDAEVREEHASLDGMVKPVNDPDWDMYTPPLGFRCRCWLEQTLDDVTETTPNVKIDEQFCINTGKTGEVFTEDHNYFKSIPEYDRDVVTENTDKIKESMNK